MDQLKSQVRNSFTKLRHALDLREKLLLRQIDVLKGNNKIDFADVSFQVEPSEEKILELLRNYGSYLNIDCYLPYLENENEDMSNLFEKSLDNKRVSESIINLTLQESQNLISKSSNLVTFVCDKLKMDPPKSSLDQAKVIDKSIDQHGNGNVKSIKPKIDAKVKNEPDDGKLKRNDTTTSSKKKSLKNISNLTLNNSNGSIVLKNISNVTINTCKQPKITGSKEIANSPTLPKQCSTSKSCEGSFYQCDFYERLISENEVLKRSIVNQSLCTTYPDPISAACMCPPTSTSQNKSEYDDCTYSINSTVNDTTTSSMTEGIEDGFVTEKNQKEKMSVDPSIEEITTKTMVADKLITDHPPMIQCWLNKMLLETETESHNMADILEVSNIT